MNGSDDLPEMFDRLARLERQNRRLRASMCCLLGLAAVVAAAVFAIGSVPAALAVSASRPAAAAAGTVQAREFRLVDRSGRVRGLMNLNAQNDPQLVFLDEQGKPTFSIPGKPRIMSVE